MATLNNHNKDKPIITETSEFSAGRNVGMNEQEINKICEGDNVVESKNIIRMTQEEFATWLIDTKIAIQVSFENNEKVFNLIHRKDNSVLIKIKHKYLDENNLYLYNDIVDKIMTKLKDNNRIQTDEKTIKLKPCPFCGNTKIVIKYCGEAKVFCIKCSKCIVEMINKHQDLLHKYWNKRDKYEDDENQ